MKSQRQSLIEYVNTIPADAEFTSTSVSRNTRMSSSYVSAVLGELRDAGKIAVKREERGETGKRWRYVYTRKGKDGATQASFKRSVLRQYTNDELVEELRARLAG
jgi:transcription initiation factor IIE alpha subunit